MSDEEHLVASARNGDTAAFGELMQRHEGVVDGYELQMLNGDRDAAADLTQDTFLLAYERLERYQGGSKFRTWVIGIAVNQVRAFFRKRRPRAIGFNEASPDGFIEPDVLEQRDAAQLIQCAFSQLSIGQREAIYLREFLEYSYEEVALTLGISVDAVKNRIHLGRKEMIRLVNEMSPM